MGLKFEKMKLVLRVAVCVKFRVMFDTVYQVTMSLELCHKERNNVLSLRNNERWHLTRYTEHHPTFQMFTSGLSIFLD